MPTAIEISVVEGRKYKNKAKHQRWHHRWHTNISTLEIPQEDDLVRLWDTEPDPSATVGGNGRRRAVLNMYHEKTTLWCVGGGAGWSGVIACCT